MTDRYEKIRKALAECRDIAMEWTMRGRIPECGKFGEIAQDLGAVCAELENSKPITDDERDHLASDELIERLRADAELIHNNGITRKLRRHRVAALLREAAAALEAAREDSERLDWLASECIPEGIIHVESDAYEYACEVAGENGRDEPIDADHFAGYRRMIDAARANDILYRTASQAGGAQ